MNLFEKNDPFAYMVKLRKDEALAREVCIKRPSRLQDILSTTPDVLVPSDTATWIAAAYAGRALDSLLNTRRGFDAPPVPSDNLTISILNDLKQSFKKVL